VGGDNIVNKQVVAESHCTFIVAQLVEDGGGGLLHGDGVPQAVARDDDEVLAAVQVDGGHVGHAADVRLVVAVAWGRCYNFEGFFSTEKLVISTPLFVQQSIGFERGCENATVKSSEGNDLPTEQ
jgi:hypothetical protein